MKYWIITVDANTAAQVIASGETSSLSVPSKPGSLISMPFLDAIATRKSPLRNQLAIVWAFTYHQLNSY